MKVTIFMPVMNEEQGCGKIIPQIKKEWYDQMIVVDNNSKDKTVEVCKNLGVEVISQKGKGLNAAYREVWPLITGDIVITFSPDGNSVPEKIPELIEKMKEGYDMVIASRYKDNAKSYDDTILTGFGNWIFTKSINLFHKANYTDAMVMFRAYKKDIWYELNMDNYMSNYGIYEKLFFTEIGIEPLLSIRCAKKKLKTSEIPADEPKRYGGRSKLQIIRWGLAFYSQVLVEIFFNNFEKK